MVVLLYVDGTCSQMEGCLELSHPQGLSRRASMDLAELKFFYVRKHSTNLRFWTDIERPDGIEESPTVTSFTGIGRAVLLIFCRNKQRLLMQAWEKWQEVVAWEDEEKTGRPIHDYSYDLRCILSRATATNEPRKEIEIEVLYKWVVQNRDVDPSGIPSFLYKCTSRAAVIRALNEMRLEVVAPGDIIVVQDTFSRPEDGTYTA